MNEGFSVDIPRGIYAEVQCNASNIEEACASALNAAMTLKAYLSLSANASVGDFDVELAFQAMEGEREHEYMQQFVKAPSGVPQPGRWVAAEPTRAFVEAVAAHHRMDRLHRAIVHYDLALRYWRKEFAILSLSHLWIATEALTRVARDRLKSEMGLPDENALAAKWGIEKKRLDPEIRKRIIFHGDEDTYRGALRASDAYEHSFEDFHAVWGQAKEVVAATASHVRVTILEQADVPMGQRTILTASPFDRPYEAIPLTRRRHGKLTGSIAGLAAPNQAYPYLKWSSRLIAVARDAAGLYQVTPTDSITPVIGHATSFTPTRMEWWGPAQDPPAPSQPQRIVLNATVTPAPQLDAVGRCIEAMNARAKAAIDSLTRVATIIVTRFRGGRT